MGCVSIPLLNLFTYGRLQGPGKALRRGFSHAQLLSDGIDVRKRHTEPEKCVGVGLENIDSPFVVVFQDALLDTQRDCQRGQPVGVREVSVLGISVVERVY